MKVHGTDASVVMIQPEDEIAHAHGSDINWQESVVIYVWDVEQKCYVYFRIGHEPGHGNRGLAVVWCNIWTPDKYYKRYDTFDLEEDSLTKDGFGGAGLSRYSFDGKHHWTMQDGAVNASLTMEDFHQPFGFNPTSYKADEIAKNHFEASGKVSGTIEFEGKRYILENAIGYRDHSWGVRKWALMRSFRWIPAIFGNDLITQATGMLGPDWSLSTFGYVIRDGELFVPTHVDIVTLLESDGLTQRGGSTVFTLEDGEKVEITYNNIGPAGMSFHYGLCGCEAMSTAKYKGRNGVGAFTTGNNTMGGVERPRQSMLISGYVDNGIYSYRNGSPSILRL